MSDLDGRAERSRQELDMAFRDTEVPGAATIVKRHRRGRLLQASIAGAFALVVAIGVGTAVANDSDDQSITPADSTSSTTVAPALEPGLLGTWTVDPASSADAFTGNAHVTFTDTPCSTEANGVFAEGPCYAYSGHDVCNAFSGGYRTEGQLILTLGGRRTEVACADSGLSDILLPGVKYDVTGDTLLLTLNGTSLSLVRSAETTSTTTSTTIDPAVSSGQPEATSPRMVAATSSGAIVALADDGSIARVILEQPDVMVGDIQLVGESVYFTTKPAGTFQFSYDCGPLMRVSFAGGEPEAVGYDANFFAVSPEGSRVALSQLNDCEGIEEARLSIVDLTGGARREWTPAPDDPVNQVPASHPQALAWSPDGRTLASEWCYETCGTHIIDPSRDGVAGVDDTYVDGDTPVFLGNRLWTRESVYVEDDPSRPPANLYRYEAPYSAVAETRPSPFPRHVWYMEAGPETSILAMGREESETPVYLQRWNIGDGDATQLGGLDQTLILLTTG